MEEVPKVTQTIAAIRSNRIAEKISEARKKIVIDKSWWNSSAFEVFLLLIFTSFNFFYISPFWGTSASEEAIFSGPVVPLITKFVQIWVGSFSYSLQYVNIFFFALLPISLYFFIKRITKRKIVAFLSILFVNLPLSYFAETRISSAFLSSDGAHIAALSVIPFALLALFNFLRKGSGKSMFASSLLSSLIVLISPFGFATYLIFASILTFSEILLGSGRKKLIRFLTILLFAGSISCFWYNPTFSFWLLTGPLGMEVRRTVFKLLPISFFALPVLTTFGYLLFDRKPALQTLFLASFFVIAFMVISLAGGGIFPSSPSRYIPEIGISLSFLLSVTLVKFFEWLPLFQEKTIFRKVGFVAVFALLGLGIVIGRTRIFAGENVLGIWTGVERGAIWQERDKFDGISTFFGYTISFLGFIGLSLTSIRSRKEVEAK